MKKVAPRKTSVMVAEGIKPWGQGTQVILPPMVTLENLNLTGVKKSDIFLYQQLSTCSQMRNGKRENSRQNFSLSRSKEARYSQAVGVSNWSPSTKRRQNEMLSCLWLSCPWA